MTIFRKFSFVFITLIMVFIIASCGKKVTEIKSIEFVKQPKSVYTVDDPIEIEVKVVVGDNETSYTISYTKQEGVQLKITGQDNPINITKSGFTITGIDTSQAGKKTAVIKYSKDGSSASIVFTYEIKEKEVITNPLFAGGTGTSNDPFLVANREQLNNITKMFNENSNYYYYKIANGISRIDASNWTPINLWGSFDGNGVTFTNLDNTLFAYVGNKDYTPNKNFSVTIQNFNIDDNARIIKYDSFAALVVARSSIVNLTFKNINIGGYLQTNGIAASLLALGPGNYASSNNWASESHITIENVISTATLVSFIQSPAGFIAHQMEVQSSSDVKIKDSAYLGLMVYPKDQVAKYVDGNPNYAPVIFDYSQDFRRYLVQKGINNIDDLHKATNYTNEHVYKLNAQSFERKRINNNGNELDKLPAYGETFTVDAVQGATKATFALIAAPNDKNNKGNFVSTYVVETVQKSNDKFISNNVKHFKVRVNPTGVQETGADGEFFNIVNPVYGNTKGSSSFVLVIQTDDDNRILGVEIYYFNDKELTWIE